MIIRIYPSTFVCFASTILHRSFFREHNARAANSVFSECDQVPIGWPSVFRFVLAHRRNNNAIARINPTKGNWLKKKRKAHTCIMHGDHLNSSIAMSSMKHMLKSDTCPHFCSEPLYK